VQEPTIILMALSPEQLVHPQLVHRVHEVGKGSSNGITVLVIVYCCDMREFYNPLPAVMHTVPKLHRDSEKEQAQGPSKGEATRAFSFRDAPSFMFSEPNQNS
jgi:hypothetical protein